MKNEKLPSGRSLSTAIAVLGLTVGAACSDVTGPLDAQNVELAGSPVGTTNANPLNGMFFFVDAQSNARRTVDLWRSSRPSDAALMEKIASAPQAYWFGGWNADVEADVKAAVSSAASSSATPVLVAYNIPQRDCGSYSAGGASSPDGYRNWIRAFARGISSRQALVILEPDALAGMDCLNSTDRQTRLDLLSFAVKTLRDAGAMVYLDAGHSRWHSVETMAPRLKAAGIEQATGFSLNVSNFHTTAEQITYGNALSALVNGKHYVIDTSRNGLGSAGDSEWCNPDGRALGERPNSNTGHPLVDAYLWVKRPGESDGACNGNPAAGTWMPEYALGLAKRAK